MNAISSKSTFQVSQHDDGAGKGEKGFTAKCFMMGGVAVAAFALLTCSLPANDLVANARSLLRCVARVDELDRAEEELLLCR